MKKIVILHYFSKDRVLYLRSKIVDNYNFHIRNALFSLWQLGYFYRRKHTYKNHTVLLWRVGTPHCWLFHRQWQVNVPSGTLTALESKYPKEETPSSGGKGSQSMNVPGNLLIAGRFCDELLGESPKGCAYSSSPHIRAPFIAFVLPPLVPTTTSQINKLQTNPCLTVGPGITQIKKVACLW